MLSNIKTFQGVDIFEIARDAEVEFLGSELVCLTRRLWTVADAPSRVSHRCTIHRWCCMIFCAASHIVGDNKLCVILLIFHLDLNYVMGSRLQRMVFELLELLFVVNVQLYVCLKIIGIIQGSFGHLIH